MDRIMQMAIFIGVFIIVFASLNFYVLSRIYSIFNLKKNAFFYVLFAAFSLSFILASFLGRIFSGQFTNYAYVLASTWIGVVFLLFIAMIISDVARLSGAPPKTTGLVLLGLALILSVYSLINAAAVRTNAIDVNISGLGQDITAIQLSDLHIGAIHGKEYLARIVAKVNSLNPDVVFITGDLVDGSGPLQEGFFEPIDEINAPVYFSPGNHEHYEGIDAVLQMLEKTKMTILRNEKAEFNGVQIIGVDFSDSKKYLETVLPNITYNEDSPTVLLFHSPDSFEYAASKGVDLVLSGHTHVGQIFPFNFLVKMRYSRINGIYRERNSTLYVSSGAGTWGPPMRLGSHSEIVVLRLKKN